MLNVVVGVFVWLLGLCIGSFLNVVIYRLPQGMSVGQPTWSFCPGCRQGIAWYDNIPLLSWLLLRGRCRRCGAAISLQYPIVEALTGLAFVLVFWLLFETKSRVGLDWPALPGDAPLLLAWLVLAACLIGCSGMDIVAYVVDTRLIFLAVVVGILAHAHWPQPNFVVPRAAEPLAAAGTAAFLASVVMLWLTPVEEPAPPGRSGELASEDVTAIASQPGEAAAEGGELVTADHAQNQVPAAPSAGADDVPPTTSEPSTKPVLSNDSTAITARQEDADGELDATAQNGTGGLSSSAEQGAAGDVPSTGAALPESSSIASASLNPALGGLLIVLVAGVSLLILASNAAAVQALGLRIDHLLWAGFGLIFILTSLAGAQQRTADHEIHALIEAERPRARRGILYELLWLAPIVAAGGVAWWLVARTDGGHDFWHALVSWQLGAFRPAAGAIFAMHGAMVAAALGWVVRIVFTLAFGREAFATGDIFILSAAGAATGWDIGLLGFAMSIPVALAGWMVSLALKRTSMIPFGPWLTIGFLLALWWNRPAAEYATRFLEAARGAAGERPELVLLFAALMIGALIVAVVAAGLLRQVIEPRQQHNSG